MRKLLTISILAALVVTACGGGSNATAATVNGQEITVGEVESLMDTAEEATISKEDFAQFLSARIQWAIVIAAAEEDYDIVISDDEISTEVESIIEDPTFNPNGLEAAEFAAENGVTEEFLRSYAHQQLLDTAIREELAPDAAEPTPEEIEARTAEAALGLAEVCASHILVATEDEANDVLARLEDGEVFADIAGEVSLDTASGAEGGVLECSPPTRYVTEFADAAMGAELNEVTGPVETQFGFHLILVTERTEADPAEIPGEEEIIEALKAESVASATNDWFVEQVEGAEVTVEEQYGTWQASPPQVVPPTE